MTISATFTGLVLAKISILPKISRFCLFALHRPINVWHTWEWQRSDGSLCFRIALTVLWCHTTIGLHSVASSQMGEWTPLICTCICIALAAHSRPHLWWLVDYIQCQHVILGNTEILARTCPVKMARLANLVKLGPPEYGVLRPTLNAAQCSSVLLQR